MSVAFDGLRVRLNKSTLDIILVRIPYKINLGILFSIFLMFMLADISKQSSFDLKRFIADAVSVIRE